MPKPIAVLVTGATGQQGGAVARALLDRGHRVRALTRRPWSPDGAALTALGAEVVAGDFDDPASLGAAMRGCDAAFLVTTPFEAGLEAETTQGLALCQAAHQAGLGHVVYSSAAGADRRTGVPHFDSKLAVEQHLKRLRLPFTILGPTFFMENWAGAYLAGLRGGAVTVPLSPGRRLHQLALADLGAFAVACLERRTEFQDRRIELASDATSGEETAAILGEASGRALEYRELPSEVMRRQSPELASMFAWLDSTGQAVDVAGLRRSHPEVGWHTLRDWARAQDWGALLDRPRLAAAAGAALR